LAAAVTVLGYLMGRYFYCTVKTFSGTELAMSTPAQFPVEIWQGVQTKIDKIAGDVHELQAYVSKQKLRFSNTAKR